MLIDRSRVLVAHVSPEYDDGQGLTSDQPNEKVAALFGTVDYNLLIVGHTYQPFDRTLGGGLSHHQFGYCQSFAFAE